MDSKRQRNSSSSDSSLSEMLEKLNKAKISKKTGDAGKLEIDMRANQIQPKDVKRVPKKTEPLNLGIPAASPRSNKKATTAKNKKKAATDRPGKPRRNGRTTRSGRTAKNNKKAATDRPRAQSDPNIFRHYRSPRSFNSSSRSSSSARRKYVPPPPVRQGLPTRVKDVKHMQMPNDVLERLKKMDIKA